MTLNKLNLLLLLTLSLEVLIIPLDHMVFLKLFGSSNVAGDLLQMCQVQNCQVDLGQNARPHFKYLCPC